MKKHLKIRNPKLSNAVSLEHDDSDNRALQEALNVSDQVKEGIVVKGTVIGVSNKSVIIDANLKNECTIPLSQFQLMVGSEIPKSGDVVDVYIDKLEGKSGKTVISREKAIRQDALEDIKRAYRDKTPVMGAVFKAIKGGFLVDLSGLIAFLPGSQADIKPIKDPSTIMNTPLLFQIIKIDLENVVVSRKKVIEESLADARDDVLKNLKIGSVIVGTVKNVTDYGAFLQFGHLDGLLHVMDMSWKRVNHPSEVVRIGQELEVAVIQIDPEKKRIHLGLKQLTQNPWSEMSTKYKPGDIVMGRVLSMNDAAVLVEIVDDSGSQTGLEAVLPSGEISWSKIDQNPKKRFMIDDEVECMVHVMDHESSKMIVSIKRMKENPYANFAKKHQIGDVMDLTIIKITGFGMFVDLGEISGDKIDGMIHESNISWNGDGQSELRKYSIGDKITAALINVEPEKERIEFSIKHLTKDPYHSHYEKIQVGSNIEARVVGIKKDFCLNLETLDGAIPAIVKKSDLAIGKHEQKTDSFAIGDIVTATVINIDRGSHVVYLSIKAIEEARRNQIAKEFGSTSESIVNLGSMIDSNTKQQ